MRKVENGERRSERGGHEARDRSQTASGRSMVPRRGRIRLRASALAAVVSVLWMCGLASSQDQTSIKEKSASDQLPQINSDGWTSSAICGECHQAIHAVWGESLHSKSWSNAVFQAGYRRSVETHGKEESGLCLSCHAPTVRHSKDFEVKEPITAEGVTCDYCHSISAVDVKDPFRTVEFEVGKTKYGPLRHAQSPAHEIKNSRLHTRSEFCASCHEYRNSNGVSVLSTYSEWKASSYGRRGKQCQDCHMPLVAGRVVALSVKRDSGTSVNLHNISGSHDLERVRKAITLKLEGYEWIGDRIWVHLRASNVGSGHCFPTGLPMHRAVLEVTLRDGSKLVDHREIPFEIILIDKEGNQIRREHEAFLEAAKIWSDTRLKPEESREIEVVFRDVNAARLTVHAKLFYEYSTEALVVDKDGERIEPVDMKFLVVAASRTMNRPGR